jgi:hypothetical protein
LYYTTQMPMLVSRQFDDEVIVANFETGIYYSLTGTAADIWCGLQCGATAGDIASALAARGGDRVGEATQIVANFVETLLLEKLIGPISDTVAKSPWSLQFSDTFSEPKLERFDDLRDLLFLDPVHDVSEAGWPVQAKDVD